MTQNEVLEMRLSLDFLLNDGEAEAGPPSNKQSEQQDSQSAD